MPRCLLIALTAMSLHAAAIRGTIVEKQSGKPLARALVVVQPVAGSPGATASTRSNTYGAFELSNLRPGLYLVTASKTGFSTTEYGRKRWFSAGTPVNLEASTELTIRIALPHPGAITGRVVDENNVGLAGVGVLVYRNTRPLVMAGSGTSDDRGVYRVFGLEPGSYLVRTKSIENELGLFVPTFARETTAADAAAGIDAILDEDSISVEVRPISGRLINVTGRVGNSRAPAVLTLVSDLGTFHGSADNGTFDFGRIPAGTYEVYAQAPDARTHSVLQGYLTLDLDRDRGFSIDVAPLPAVHFSITDPAGKPVDPTGLPLLLRRVDLSGPGEITYAHLDQASDARLEPGHWRIALGVNAAWYMARFSGPGYRPSPDGPASWNEIVVTPSNQAATVEIGLANTPAFVQGIVTSSEQPAAGVPVFLEAVSPGSGRRMGELHTTRTGVDGHYSFLGLPPGSYRLLASFEYASPTTAQMITAHAAEVTVEEGGTLTRNLTQWVMP